MKFDPGTCSILRTNLSFCGKIAQNEETDTPMKTEKAFLKRYESYFNVVIEKKNKNKNKQTKQNKTKNPKINYSN